MARDTQHEHFMSSVSRRANAIIRFIMYILLSGRVNYSVIPIIDFACEQFTIGADGIFFVARIIDDPL